MFLEPIQSFLNSSIVARSRESGLLSAHIISILHSVANHHAVDDTPYGGGPGELMKIDVIAPLIEQALALHDERDRTRKRVVLMDPAGTPFTHAHAERLATFEELIFVCGRYEGIDARIHHYVDEAMSIGDFVLSAGDIAAMTIFDATARMLDGHLGNFSSIAHESHSAGRLESSHYTRPFTYEGHSVPSVLTSGHHQAIEQFRLQEAALKTRCLRPDLIELYPLTDQEQKLLTATTHDSTTYPWVKK